MGSLSWAPFHGLPFMGSLSWAPFHGLPFMGSLSWAPFHGLPFMGSLPHAQAAGGTATCAHVEAIGARAGDGLPVYGCARAAGMSHRVNCRCRTLQCCSLR